MIKTISAHKIISFAILLFLAFSFGCGNNDSSETSISGELKNLPKGSIKLTLEEDINRKISKNIAEIPVDENGRFKFEGDLVPHIYSLKIKVKTSSFRAMPPIQIL
jgi:hypothetical protein